MRSEVLEGVVRLPFTVTPAGVCLGRELGEMRGVSDFEYAMRSFADWWERPATVEARRIGELALFMLPELLALRGAATVSQGWSMMGPAIEGLESAAAVAAETGARTVVKAARELSDVEYLERLRRYLARPGRRVRADVKWGVEAGEHLARGERGRMDAFADGSIRLLFQGQAPGRLVIHHELEHFLDLVRNFGGNVREFARRSESSIELHVHYRLVRGKRWDRGDYAFGDKNAQLDYGQEYIELRRMLGMPLP